MTISYHGRDAFLTTEDIRNLNHQVNKRFIDITPVFFFVGTLAIVARVISLGIGSKDLYILAGGIGGFFMGMRYFLFQSMRGDY